MKRLKTKIVGIALAATMLFSGTTVLASPSEGDTGTMTNATTILYGQSAHVDLSSSDAGKWFCYTATEKQTVWIYSYNNTTTDSDSSHKDTYVRLYNSSGEQKAYDDDGAGNRNFGLRYTFEAGSTYYIWVTKYYTGACSFDFTITYPSAPRILADDTVVSTSSNDSVSYTIPEGADPTIVLDPQGPSGSTYKWYRYSYFDLDFVEISGATASTLTVGDLGDQFRADVNDGSGVRSFYFRITSRDYNPVIDNGVVQSLANEGQTATAVAPDVSGTLTSTVRYSVCPTYYNMWLPSHGDDETVMPVYDNPVTIPAFNRTVFDSVYPTEEFYSSSWFGSPCNFMGGTMSSPLLAFVRYDGNSSTIALDQPQQVSLTSVDYGENDYPGIIVMMGNFYPECMVYSFTPDVSGTYTLTSSDIVSGDPYVALFDSEFALVDFRDNIDGSFFFDNFKQALIPAPYAAQPGLSKADGDGDAEAETDYNFAFTQHLNGGETYYYVVWSSVCFSDEALDDLGEDGTMAEYTVTLTRDSIDTFNVNVTTVGTGTASASPVSGCTGTEVTLTATPGSGYQFSSWEVVSGGVTINNNNTFTIGNSDVEIRANFEAIPTQAPTTAPTTPTPAIPGNDNPSSTTEGGVAGFVERLYTVALGRSSDPVGKQDWIDAITLRGETGADAARGFLFSPEFLEKQCTNEEFVATLYRTFFDREPDQAGFNAWVEVLNNGASKEEVIEGFINSTEWANLCLFYGIRNGGTGVPNIEIEPNDQTIAFATRLYTTCLGRDADPNGLMAWARQLANQRDTGSGAAHGFFFSEEFINQNVSNSEYVTRLYRTFMDREPDQAGFDAWVAQLDQGVSREEVFNGFANSIEFARICAAYGIVK